MQDEFAIDSAARDRARRGGRYIMASLAVIGFVIMVALISADINNDTQMIIVFVMIVTVLIVPFFAQDVLYEKYKRELQENFTKE